MLGIGGRFAGAKGMATMPNLSGLTPPQAEAAIIAAGLVIGSKTSSSTSDSGQDNKVNSQSVSAGILVDYETSINYNYLYYVAPYQPTITYGACEPYEFIGSGTFCTGQQQCSGGGIMYFRRQILADGSWTGGYDYSGCATQITDSNCEYVDGECEYTKLVVCTGTAGCTDWYESSCSGGQYYQTRRCWDACGNEKRTTNYYNCCTPSTVCTAWSGSSGGQSRTCTVTDSKCNTSSYVETRCAASCGSWYDTSKCTTSPYGKYKTQARTCSRTDCSTYTETRTVSC